MIFVFIGSLLKVDLVWELADTFNALMVIPNLIAVLALSGLVAKSMNDYEEFRGINIDKTKSLKN